LQPFLVKHHAYASDAYASDAYASDESMSDAQQTGCLCWPLHTL
jgi:hypothetical protein